MEWQAGQGALSQRPALSAAVGKKDENQFTVAIVAHRKERMCRADVYKTARGRVLHVCAQTFLYDLGNYAILIDS